MRAMVFGCLVQAVRDCVPSVGIDVSIKDSNIWNRVSYLGLVDVYKPMTTVKEYIGVCKSTAIITGFCG